MTPAERAYRLALLAYPAPYRRERGPEILTTILDGGEERWPRLREVLAVVVDGAERRGRIAGGGSRAGSLRAGVRLAAFAWLLPYAVAGVMWGLYPYIGAEWVGGGGPLLRSEYLTLVSLAGVLTLMRGWWWGPLLVSLATTAVSAIGYPAAALWPWQDAQRPVQAWVIFALGFVPGIACVLARPRGGEPSDRRSLLWLPLVAVAGAVFAWQGLFLTSWLGRPMGVALIAAFLLARRDPRLAVAAAGVALLAATDRIATPYGYGTVWLGAGAFLSPLLIAFAVAALWRTRWVVA